MKYITGTFDGNELKCQLEQYTNSQGQIAFFPLVANNANLYGFRLSLQGLNDEWNDIRNAVNNRWVIFENTKLPYPVQTTAMPLSSVQVAQANSSQTLEMLQADIPSYILSASGYLSITIMFTIGGKTLVSTSNSTQGGSLLQILPANGSLDSAIYSNLSVEDKTLYHELIGTLMGGSENQVLVKTSRAGTMGYAWQTVNAFADGLIYGGTAEIIQDNSSGNYYLVSQPNDNAVSKIVQNLGISTLTTPKVCLVDSTSTGATKTIINNVEYMNVGYDACKNIQFLIVESGASAQGAWFSAYAVNDYAMADGDKWNQLPSLDSAALENLMKDRFVTWSYGEGDDDTVRTLNKIDISGNAGTATTADKVKNSLTIGSGEGAITFDGSAGKTLSKIPVSWVDGAMSDLVDGVVTTNKIADGAVTGVKIGDGQVSNAKLAGSIGWDKLSGTIPDSKLAIANSKITNAMLAGSIGWDKLSGTIPDSKLAIGSGKVTNTMLAGSIELSKINISSDQIRKITYGTSAPSGGASGDIYLKYS